MCLQWVLNINSRFKTTSTYSSLARLKDAGFPICSLWEAHRCYTKTLHYHLSTRYYNGLMIDGTVNGSPPPPLITRIESSVAVKSSVAAERSVAAESSVAVEKSVVEVRFGYEFIEGKFGVKDNWVVVTVEGSRSSIEDNGTSMLNAAHELLVMEYIHDLIDSLDGTQLAFDKTKFTTKVICPYTAQVNRVRNQLLGLGDGRFVSLTGKVIQGVEGHAVILHIPNARSWTEFVNDKRDLLVELTRQRYILIVIISGECVLPASYGLKNKWQMSRSKKANNIFDLVNYAADNGNLVSVNAPDARPCNICEQLGHKGLDCPRKRECYNCGALDHHGDNVHCLSRQKSHWTLGPASSVVSKDIFSAIVLIKLPSQDSATNATQSAIELVTVLTHPTFARSARPSLVMALLGTSLLIALIEYADNVARKVTP
jgi:hypothetical protein